MTEMEHALKDDRGGVMNQEEGNQDAADEVSDEVKVLRIAKRMIGE